MTRDVQQEFEHAQLVAFEMRKPVIISLKMAIYPPEVGDERFGMMKYSVKTVLPAKESKVLTTELDDGFIVKDGQDLADILQEEIEFPDLQLNTPLTLNRSEDAHG